jgi:DNA replication regulator SLD3
MLLPREHLPLSCLDLATPCGEFEQARQYESTVKILDLESRLGSRPVVLIARMETNKTAYALERQDVGLYTLCRLGDWIDLGKLSGHATVAYTKLLKPRLVQLDMVRPSASTTPQLHKESKKRRLAMEAIQSLVKRPAKSQSTLLPPQATEATPAPAASVSIVREVRETAQAVESSSELEKRHELELRDGTSCPAAASVLHEASSIQTADEIFENVRLQYFEALYHSMVSTTVSV